MSANDLTKFLWNEHKLVYLRPANAVDFELLDVLVKVKDDGIFRQRPVLQRIGSIFGKAGSGAQLKREEEGEAEGEEGVTNLEALKQELHELRSCGSSGKYIHTSDHGSWSYKSGDSARLEGSAMNVGALGFGGMAGKEIIINNVESEHVDSIALAECLSSTINPWTPNIDYIRQLCAPRNQRKLELWVVTKLFYHSGLKYGSTTGLDAGVGISGFPVKFGGRWKKSREAGMESSATQPGANIDNQPTSWIPFAYQAIKLTFSLIPDAKLINPSLQYMGRRRPCSLSFMSAAKPAMGSSMETAMPFVEVTVEAPMPVMGIKGGENIIIDPDDEPDFNMGELLDMETWDSLEIETISS